MPLTDPLIADYLRRKGLYDTLKSFESHVGVQPPINYEKLEDIVSDRIAYLHHSNILEESKANSNIENGHLFPPWSLETPSTSHVVLGGQLVIHLSHGKVNDREVVFMCCGDKSLKVMDLQDGNITYSYQGLHVSVLKLCVPICDNRVLTCGMDGKIKLVELHNDDTYTLIEEYQAHARLLTDLQTWNCGSETFLISIGWDSLLKVHKLCDDKITPVSEFKLLSNATSLEVCSFNGYPIVVLTRMDSSQLSYFTCISQTLVELTRISLNDAEFSTHGFTGMSVSASSDNLTKDAVVVVGTSHSPYMRLIITRTPDLEKLINDTLTKGIEALGLGEQQLTTVTLRGYILMNLTTPSPQDKFSHSKIFFRSDRSGVWICGDDGIIRGMELRTGEVVHELKKHQGRIKYAIDCSSHGVEKIVACGVDKTVVLWE
jgi:WD40 repeat protein